MRLLNTGVAALALTTLTVLPASACPWDKTAQADNNMTVAETVVVPDIDTDVAIATNDISDAVLPEATVLPVPGDKPAE
ncbi:hypothetical protein [Roseibium sp. M-1]